MIYLSVIARSSSSTHSAFLAFSIRFRFEARRNQFDHFRALLLAHEHSCEPMTKRAYQVAF